MSDILTRLKFYFDFPFVRYAFIVGILIALCSSLLGVVLVLKRFSFIGDGLSHIAFGALAVATIFNLTNDTVVVMPVTIVTAILLLRTGQNTRLKGDAAIAMLSVGALAIGYLVMNIFSTSANVSGDVCSTLFGSTTILTLTAADVSVCIAASIVVVLFFCLFYNRIFAVTFDESFTRASGKNAELYNMVIAVITAVIIVLAMNLVGSLLITALLIFPALSAMRVMRSFKAVIIYSAVISVVGATIGLLVSILFSTPVGATIVVVDMLVFGVNCGIGKAIGR
jgi:zinc transport system permease protein